MRKVVLMDLLCMAPYYDSYLIKALNDNGLPASLAAISFHLDLEYFKKNNIKIDPGLLNIVAQLGIKSQRLRSILKGLEYGINLLVYSVRFIFARPQVLHIQWLPMLTRSKIELLFVRWVRFLGIKIVYTVHNIMPHDTEYKYFNIFKSAYELPHALICHTEETRVQLENNFGIRPDKIWVIPHGLMFHDHEEIDCQRAREALDLNCTFIYVLCFGIIRPYKGIEFLLESWKKVVESCNSAKLIIAGGGDLSYIEEIRQTVIDLDLAESVVYRFGFISTKELPLYHIASDILVYPYKSINQSGALLTGLSFGKAIIASRTGGFMEILTDGDNAILVEYGNVEDMSKALLRLINDPGLRNSLSSSVIEKAQTDLSWNVIAQKTIECYKKVNGYFE